MWQFKGVKVNFMRKIYLEDIDLDALEKINEGIVKTQEERKKYLEVLASDDEEF